MGELTLEAEAHEIADAASVRYNGTLHDFVLLNPRARQRAAGAAVEHRKGATA